MQFLCPYIYLYLLYALFLACTYFVPPASLPRCVCVSSFQRSLALCVYTGSVSFSGSTGGDNLSTPPLSTGK